MLLGRFVSVLVLAALATTLGGGASTAGRRLRPHPPRFGLPPNYPYAHGLLLPPSGVIIEFNQGYSEPLLPSPRSGAIFPPTLSPSYPQEAPGGRAPLTYSGSSMSQGMVMTVRKILNDDRDGGPPKSSPVIGRPRQAVDQLAECWSPPPPPRGETVEITIRFAFDREGGVAGTPRVTYVKPGAGASADAVRESILAAVKACTPLRFTASMAASAPGYPLAVRFIGQRADEGSEGKP